MAKRMLVLLGVLVVAVVFISGCIKGPEEKSAETDKAIAPTDTQNFGPNSPGRSITSILSEYQSMNVYVVHSGRTMVSTLKEVNADYIVLEEVVFGEKKLKRWIPISKIEGIYEIGEVPPTIVIYVG